MDLIRWIVKVTPPLGPLADSLPYRRHSTLHCQCQWCDCRVEVISHSVLKFVMAVKCGQVLEGGREGAATPVAVACAEHPPVTCTVCDKGFAAALVKAGHSIVT